MIIENKVIALVLKEFQNVLRELIQEYGEDKVQKYGASPNTAIVKYCNRFNVISY